MAEKHKSLGEACWEELKELLELCLVIIERDFAPCGLKHDVKKRIIKLYEQWKKAKVELKKRELSEDISLFSQTF